MSFLKSKKFRKARKFLYIFSIVFLVAFLTVTPVTVSALGPREYYFNGNQFFGDDGRLVVSDNYSGRYTVFYPEFVNVEGENGATAQWLLPPWTSPSSSGNTAVYIRFAGMQGIDVRPGEVLEISIDFAYWGLTDYTWNFAIGASFLGWAKTKDNWFGRVQPAIRNKFVYKWTNDDKYAGKIEYLYFTLTTPNPTSWNNEVYLETLYDNLVVRIYEAGAEDKVYSDFDNSDVIRFEQNEADLIGSIDGDLDKTTSFFDGVTDLFNKDDTGNGWIKGAFVVGDMFRLWYSVPWVKKLVDISLVLGAFALVFGVTVWAAGSIGGRASRLALHRYNSKKGD